MTIKNFVENFKNANVQSTKFNPDAVNEYLRKELEVKKYIPFADKRELCKKAIDACCTRDNGGFVRVDSVTRYIVFTISIISAYTKLEFYSDEEYDSLDEYDMLCESGLLNPILALIGDEYVSCNNMLNMMMDDVVANNNTVEAVFGHVLGKASDSLDDLIGAFADKVKEMELNLSQLDIDKYKWLLDLILKK